MSTNHSVNRPIKPVLAIIGWFLACVTAAILPPAIQFGLVLRQANAATKEEDRIYLLRRAAALAPWSHHVSDELALVLRERPAKLVDQLETQAQLGWLSPNAQFAYAEALGKQGRTLRAEKTLQTLWNRRILPEQSGLALATLYHQQGRYAEEWSILEEQPPKKVTRQRAILLAGFGQWNALKTLRQQITLSDIDTLFTPLSENDPFRREVAMGITLMQLGESGLASFCFERAVQFQPRIADGWAWLAIARYPTSISAAEQAMSIAQTLPHSARGKSYLLLAGQYALMADQMLVARASFEQAYQQDHSSGSALVGLGRSMEEDDLAGAFLAYQKAAELDPFDPIPLEAIAYACLQSGCPANEVALPAIRNLISLRPGSASDQILLARALANQGDLAGSISALQTAQLTENLSPEVASEILFYEGWIRFVYGQQNQAFLKFTQYSEQFPMGPHIQQVTQLLAQLEPPGQVK